MYGRSLLLTICTAALLISTQTSAARAQSTLSVDLPAQPLIESLRELSSQANSNVFFEPKLVEGLQAPAVKGQVSMDEALTRVLNGTGLSFTYLDDNTVTIIPAAGLQTRGAPTGGGAAPTRDSASDPKEGQQSSAASFQLAQADHADAAQSSTLATSSSAQAPNNSAQLQEVVVTAQKREERLVDVPIPVATINTDKLTENGQVLLRDYYATVPGLSIAPGPTNQQTLSIRGITTGSTTNSTVAFLIDDRPYGASAGLGMAAQTPDIDPGDLERIEVLRGPQGTLYGDNAMGGLIKYVTKDPSTDGYSGRAEVGATGVYNGAAAGFDVHASANIPLSNLLAFRISAYDRQDPGYIDNVVTHQDGLNEERAHGGMLSALLKAADNFSIKLNALYQHLQSGGSAEEVLSPGLGDFQQNFPYGAGAFARTVQSYGLTLKADFGDIDLTSVSGYSINTFRYFPDATTIFGSVAQKYYGTANAIGISPGDTHRVTQELRLSGKLSQGFDWLLGGFYSHERSSYPANYFAIIGATGQYLGQFLHYDQSNTFEEYAAFVNLTYHVTERFDIQLGGRESYADFNGSPRKEVGLYYTAVAHLPSPTIIPGADERGTVFTYAVTPTFKLSRDFMVYARVASGYRPGGANTTTGAPMSYAPDKTRNYEVGTKADFLDNTLSIDTSVYYIDWSDIQIQLRTPLGFAYSGNGGKAKSEGVEFSATLRPLADTTIAAWVSYDDARLTQDFVNSPTFGLKGNVIPNTPEYSGNISADQSLPLWHDWTGFIGGVVSYVGDRTGPFQPKTAPQRQDFPSYTTVDLHTGVTYGTWKFSVYANNLGNTRALIGGGLGYYEPATRIYIPPRTYGVSVITKF